ncbi:uncharacterized protein LOC128263659 [Drosophila gunungcola]|uniref:Uncharacterized protein n=1 Tax=Drosophila gunungcola TaxID=103775 RepID=A0A9P9YIM2_9MUSC|nr:uncharacterized protein LOC128263659 [Drosophila gunungcola]KAI8037690.1 hypothetical protein M5D96_009495 [Drosophila gunungcola]
MSAYICTEFLSLNLKDLPSMSTTVNLNVAQFTQRDLNLFIDSLESISRLQNKRHELRQLRQAQKLHRARMTDLNVERCSSPTFSADEAFDEPLLYLEAKCISYAVSDALNVKSFNLPGLPKNYTCGDEAYDSSSHSPRSSVTYYSCDGVSCPDSISAESGVHGSVSAPPVRPRSQVITRSKQRSTGYRIISMVLKREYVKTPYSEHPQQSEEGKKDNMHQYPQKNSKEKSFLDKALRYLTL